MKQKLEALGYEVDLQYAEDDVQAQVSQIENMITNGANCLVVASIDSSALVNALAQRAAGGADIKPGELAHVLDGLARYAVHHFATEEALMTQAGIDARHLDGHRHAHADFVAQVEAMRGASDATQVVPALYTFVTSWLTFHILDTDQSMARQLRAMEAGATAAEAYEAETGHSADPGNAALIGAVRSLLGLPG